MSDKEKYPSELAERFQIRLPPGLRDRIRSAAEGNGRSMNTEIVQTLEEAYPDPEQLAHELSFLDEIDEIQEKLERLRIAQQQLVLDQARAEMKDLDRSIAKADRLLGEKGDDT
jgi:hypothetical protein